MRDTRGIVRLGGVALAGIVLAGCGGAGTPISVPAAPSSQAPGTPSGDGDGVLVPTNLPSLPPRTAQPKPTPKPAPARPAEVFGADISWPQCPKGMGIPEKRTLGAPMPTAAAEFVIIGLTNGPSFTPNPCLAYQVRWVADRHLLAAAYSVVSYPDAATLRRYGRSGPYAGGTRAGALSNVGYQAARFNIATSRAARLRTPIVWIDVEPVPKFEWSGDLAANAAVVVGMARGYTDAGFRIGFYSTPSLWERVVGGLRVGAPEWRAAGQTSRTEALNRCGPDWSIQGGEAVFGQWVEDGRDRNVTCPGVSTSLGQWFHQY
ncbi:MAG: hypothetical protein NTV23_07270 [Propionibacteriales bacterium]|nr:hypothetical protein [Propionibacteriales bacterium]